MALPLIAAAGALSTASTVLEAFKPHKKHRDRSETPSAAQTGETGQYLPAGRSGQAGFDPAKLLARMDADGSGGVSGVEFGDFLKNLDKANGGFLALQAQEQGTSADQVAATLFGKLDADNDGSLSSSELSALGKGRDHRGPREQDGSAQGSQLSLSDQLMKSFDANGDGSISKDEITAALDATRNGRDRGASLVRNNQPNLEAMAMRAIHAYNKTLSSTSGSAAG